jgi:hypothetical protein
MILTNHGRSTSNDDQTVRCQRCVNLSPIQTCSNLHRLLVSGQLDLAKLRHRDLQTVGGAHVVVVAVSLSLDLMNGKVSAAVMSKEERLDSQPKESALS